MSSNPWLVALAILALLLVLLVAWDLLQRRHAILRNFPVIGHFRYLLEKVGPELRQYIVTANDEERPFTRDERRWIYASSKLENRYFGFGTDNDMERTPGYVIIRHAAFPAPAPNINPVHELPSAKVLGSTHGRAKAFRPNSIVNISGMSWGALSGRAVEAINRGSLLAGCLHNTGEGGISDHHLHGGELIFQVGTGYFGCRTPAGEFSMDALLATIERGPVRAIEIKLSQGAKPGHGGLLPGVKVTPEIARVRGIEPGVDCLSPPGHSAFSNVDELLEFIEQVSEATGGLPVGIKSAVGSRVFWKDLACRMRDTGTGPDFITIDGGEGGTGAAPLVFGDHVSLPFAIGMAEVYTAFAREDMHESVAFIGSGRLGLPERTLLAFALGCDMVNVAREAMLAIGCIQAQKCHTGHCPTGVATQSKWLMRGLDPTNKSVRMANYVAALRSDLIDLSRTAGAKHPALVDLDMVDVLDEHYSTTSLRTVFDYEPGWGTPPREELDALRDMLESRGEVQPHDSDYLTMPTIAKRADETRH